MFFSLLLSLLVACTRGEFPAPAETPSSVDKTILLKMVNETRSKGCQCGDTWYPSAPALSWNNQLETAAYNHSKDMSDNNYFSHDAPDGSDAGDRIRKAGYNWLTYGENIGQGYKTEVDAINAWLKSPGHCRNIMNKAHKEIGVGRVGSYWTMNVASR